MDEHSKIYFQRRNVGCWRDDEYEKTRELPVLTFDNEAEMFKYIREKQPWVDEFPEHPLRISDRYVMSWSPIGFIVDKPKENNAN